MFHCGCSGVSTLRCLFLPTLTVSEKIIAVTIKRQSDLTVKGVI